MGQRYYSIIVIIYILILFIFKSCKKNILEFTGNETISELELIINPENAFVELMERGEIEFVRPVNNIQKYANYITDSNILESMKYINSNFNMSKINSDKLLILLKGTKRDNRQDFFMVNNNQVKKNFLGVAGIVYTNDIINNNVIITESYKNLKFTFKGEKKLLCTDVNFYEQDIAPFCTAFVISHDLIITAGHCLKDVNIDSIAFVFDLKLNSPNEKISEIDIDRIYYPKNIIEIKYDTINKIDYAIVELENSVPEERILTYSLEADYEIGLKNYIIGHPSGLPLKYAPDGFVTKKPWKNYFQTNLNAFSGNSGSPIFDANTHQVIGVFIAGENKFNYYSNQDCVDIIECKPRNCTMEIGMKLSSTNIKNYIK